MKDQPIAAAPPRAGSMLSLSAYRPRGADADVLERHLVLEIRTMRMRGYITPRPVPICRSEAGEYVVALEWASGSSVDAAHRDQVVLELWERKAQLFEYIGIREVARAEIPFASYEVLTDA